MINKPTKVEISKQDITTNKELPGAHLRLEDITTGNTILIEEWVSDLKPHIIKGLIVGHIYRLTETMAPAGYKIAQSIEFTVENKESIQKLIMYNELLPQPKTGDSINMELYIGIVMFLGIGLSAYAFLKRKRVIKI